MVARLGALLTALALVNGDLITNLPGAPKVSFKQYAGYFDVGTNHHLHYWFVESMSKPTTDPLVLWLTGGPGCSGLGALLTEFGPFFANADGKTLRLNRDSWNQKANVLTIESPAGVGFSYASNGDVSTNDEQTAVENRQALKAFFEKFPQFKTNDFYIAGESYAGIYIPTLVQTILDNQADYSINVKGILIGNGIVSDDQNTDTLIQFTYNHGMIDETTWNKVKTECCAGQIDGCEFHKQSGFGFCPSFVLETTQNAWYSGINPYNIYADCYNDESMMRPLQKRYEHDFFMHTGRRRLPDSRAVICMNETGVTNYFNQPAVRTALFVPTSLPDWHLCNNEVGFTYDKIYTEMQSRVQNAVNAGIRVVLYNGDTDMVCNFLMGQRFTQKLGFPETSAKKAFHVNGQVGGYHTQYGKVEFVTIRGSGHLVPEDKPPVAFHILDAFLNNRQP